MSAIRFAPGAQALPYLQDVEAGIELGLEAHPDTEALVASVMLSARSTGFEVRLRQGDKVVKAKVAFARTSLDHSSTQEDASRRVRATASTVRRLARLATA